MCKKYKGFLMIFSCLSVLGCQCRLMPLIVVCLPVVEWQFSVVNYFCQCSAVTKSSILIERLEKLLEWSWGEGIGYKHIKRGPHDILYQNMNQKCIQIYRFSE